MNQQYCSGSGVIHLHITANRSPPTLRHFRMSGVVRMGDNAVGADASHDWRYTRCYWQPLGFCPGSLLTRSNFLHDPVTRPMGHASSSLDFIHCETLLSAIASYDADQSVSNFHSLFPPRRRSPSKWYVSKKKNLRDLPLIRNGNCFPGWRLHLPTCSIGYKLHAKPGAA